MPELDYELVEIPAGAFLMGDRKGDRNERPEHRVYLDGYKMGVHPVTNAQYGRFVEAGGYEEREFWTPEGWDWKVKHFTTLPAFWHDERWNKPDHPVLGVSWYESLAFSRWAGLRLPTEAEWEHAARGEKRRSYPWGDEWDHEKACCAEYWAHKDLHTYEEWDLEFWEKYLEDRDDRTKEVGSFPEGASPFGCLDMAGNVWEWVEDWYGPYPATAQVDPRGPREGKGRVARGGSWGAHVRECRATARIELPPQTRGGAVGFRLCVSGG